MTPYYIIYSILYLFNSLFLVINVIDTSESNSTKCDEYNLLSQGEKFLSYSQYDSAIKYFNKGRELANKRKNDLIYLTCEVSMAETYRLNGILDQAEECIKNSIRYDKSNFQTNHYIFSKIFQVYGSIYLDEGNFAKAKYYLDYAISNAKRLNLTYDTIISYAYNRLGTYYFYLGKYDSAGLCYEKALYLSSLKKNNNREIASYLQNLGIIKCVLGAYDESESYFNRAFEILPQPDSERDPLLVNIRINLGKLYFNQSKYQKALICFHEAERIYSSLTNENFLLKSGIYWNEASCYINSGDYDKGLSYLFKTLNIYESNIGFNHPNILPLKMDIGYIFEKTEKYDKAIKFYNESLGNTDNISRIRTYRNLASIYSKIGNLETAESCFKYSIEVAKRLLGKESFDLAISFLYYGEFSYNTYLKTPINWYDSSLQILKKKFGEKNRDVANAYLYLGNYFARINNCNRALTYYQMSLISITENFNDKSWLSNPRLDSLPLDSYAVDALNMKAEALFNLYRTDKINKGYLMMALKTIDEASLLMEKLRATFTSESSKILISNGFIEIHQKAIKYCLEAFLDLKDSVFLEKAFDYSERSKSMILLSEIIDSGAKNFGDIPDNLLEAEKNLNLDLESYRNFIYEEEKKNNPSVAKLKLWKDKVFVLKTKHDSLISYFEKYYPKYYQLKYQLTTADLKSIQKRLNVNTAIIEYTLADSAIYIFYVSQSRFEVRKTEPDSMFYSILKNANENPRYLDLMKYSTADFQQFLNEKYYLYNLLIKPVESLLDKNKLVIVPDKELGYLPFETLISSKPSLDTINFVDLPYLLTNHCISYSGSATILMHELAQTKVPRKNRVLAFTPAMFKKSKYDSNNSSGLNWNKNLPWAIEEVNNIYKYFKGRKYFGAEATKSNFLQQFSRYDILHFAMHASIDNENPLSSKLLFYNDSTIKDEGSLNVFEIYNLKLEGNLAVLSACSTGSGKLELSEGIMSMARAFTYAGIPSIVMTLWDVEDRTSSVLMTNYYRYLSQSMDKDEALQLAKLDYIHHAKKIETNPCFWAGYILYGDTNHLPNPETKWTYTISASIFLVFLTTAIIILRNFRINKTKRLIKA